MRTIILLLALLLSLQLAAQKPQQGFDIPIFAYHRFGDNRYPSTNISDKVFEDQLKYLKNNNYKVLTLGEAINLWQSGKAMPEKSIILTIDDGYLSFYTHGWPLLKKYGFRATNFIQTETVGGGDFMSWEQISELQKAGIEIGNHSASHAYFLNFPENEREAAFRDDLLKSVNDFKTHLKFVPEFYAYPYGEYSKGMEMILKEQGITAAVVQQSGVFCELSDPYAIPRFPMGGAYGAVQGFMDKSMMKALRVVATHPDSPFYTENPPQIKIEIVPGKIDIEKANFFVAGKKTEISEISTQGQLPFVILESDEILRHRRSLYTLTAPSTDGKSWHWFSYLWINPLISE